MELLAYNICQNKAINSRLSIRRTETTETWLFLVTVELRQQREKITYVKKAKFRKVNLVNTDTKNARGSQHDLEDEITDGIEEILGLDPTEFIRCNTPLFFPKRVFILRRWLTWLEF